MAEVSSDAGPAGDPVRVVIADDHARYRQSMTLVVELDGSARVVGQAGDGEEALAVCARVRPDVVLMDVRMPGLGGIDAVARLSVDAPDVRTVMLTMSDEEDELLEALRVGAVGCLLKDRPGEEVAEAVRHVHAGGAVLPARLAAALLDELGRRRPGPGPAQTRLLRLLARGMSQAVAVAALGLADGELAPLLGGILAALRSRPDAPVPTRGESAPSPDG
ncbi:response regulator [Phycicoccus endophyticus]|uniref:response regulator n=1 Tax=Phycicoccus endophyticus TaxID=1690220 RepID=UPI00166CE63F|nr:response regulator transcription factor [Phycicoccus endophyticus]GGL28717.1 DNA-binding response regulator [Phycicoccus endophyticus]